MQQVFFCSLEPMIYELEEKDLNSLHIFSHDDEHAHILSDQHGSTPRSKVLLRSMLSNITPPVTQMEEKYEIRAS